MCVIIPFTSDQVDAYDFYNMVCVHALWFSLASNYLKGIMSTDIMVCAWVIIPLTSNLVDAYGNVQYTVCAVYHPLTRNHLKVAILYYGVRALYYSLTSNYLKLILWSVRVSIPLRSD